MCLFCDTEECSDHAIFRCEWTRRHWVVSGFGDLVGVAPGDSCEERVFWVLQQLGEMELRWFLAMMWCIWTIWNQRLFEDSYPPAEVVCLGLVRMVADYQGYADRGFSKSRMVTEVGGCSWTPPLDGFIKFNVDAHMAGNGMVGLGAVARDEAGRLVWMGCRRVGAEWDVDVAEARAAMFGLAVANQLGHPNITLESDALNLVMAIKNKVEARTPFGLYNSR
ncbi:uncharacterized protein LOC141617140 [Silene latifolia]|uniref:uncharacterized protein LOC141617140 n=1 Tax=Silene latifolia TaxID=37657 RepID=UPI003D76DAEB